jgi:hypothetical protein
MFSCMPVGLNLLESVELKLLEAGLLPRDSSVLHRVIDFARGDFTLRWNSPESNDHTVSVFLVQQLAQRKGERPFMNWSVTINGSEDLTRSGRILLSNTQPSSALATSVAVACADLLGQAGSTHDAGAADTAEGDPLPPSDPDSAN